MLLALTCPGEASYPVPDEAAGTGKTVRAHIGHISTAHKCTRHSVAVTLPAFVEDNATIHTGAS